VVRTQEGFHTRGWLATSLLTVRILSKICNRYERTKSSVKTGNSPLNSPHSSIQPP
jgi:hypothetical protein